MADEARRLVVARLRKPHGLKGEMTLFPLTGQPERMFAPGARVWLVDLAGEVQGTVTFERSRAYHREWLVKFEGLDRREDIEELRGLFLAVDEERAVPPGEGEVWLHELIGFAIRSEGDEPLGLVSDLYELPGGLMLEVQGPKREFFLPFRKEFVLDVDRAGRRLVVRLPDGLIDE
ncbi:MAG: ribosome maturation factor RimM [Gemmatimonadota bacterium]